MTTTQQQQPSISPDEAKAIAQDAWIFGMPLVYIEIQIDTATHVPKVDRSPCPDQPVRSLPSVSRRVKPHRRGLQRRYALLARQFGSGERADGPLGAGHGDAVLGDADHRRVEQRAARSGVPDGRSAKAASSRSSGRRWKGTLPQGLTELARADEPGVHRRAHVHRRTRRLRRGPCAARPVQVGASFVVGQGRTRRPTTCRSKKAWTPRRPCRSRCWRCRPRTSSTASIACW